MSRDLDLPRIVVTDPRFQYQRKLREQIRRLGGSIKYNDASEKTWTISTKGEWEKQRNIMRLLGKTDLAHMPITGDSLI